MPHIEPKLLFSIFAKIRQIDQNTTSYDHIRREPQNFVSRGAEFEVPCQLKWVSFEEKSSTNIDQGGVDETQTGYLIVRTLDLEGLGKEIKRTNKIVGLRSQDGLWTKDVELYVFRVDFGAHYGGKFRLQKINFTDRQGKNG